MVLTALYKAVVCSLKLQTKKLLTPKTWLIMRLTIVFTLIACLQVSARGNAQTVSISGKNLTLEKVFKEIRKQAGYEFVYKTKMLDKAKTVDINAKNLSVEKVLEICFANQPFTYTIIDKTIVVKEKPTVDLQSTGISPNEEGGNEQRMANSEPPPPIDIHGRILNEKGEPVLASVQVKGTSKGTSTNDNGEFELKGVDDNATLVISGVGIETFEVKVNGRSELALGAKIKTSEGEEVQIMSTGYQQIPKERATGSFSQIENKLFNQQVSTNVLERLPSIASGFSTIPSRISSSGIFTIRGLSTLTNSIAKPLIVVDNFPYEGDIQNINPNEVENITILKDAAAASIWGARAGNGVIVITTKRSQFNQKTKLTVNSNVTIIDKPDLFYGKKISSSDLIDVEQYLFSKGYYDANLQFSSYNYETPVVDILQKQKTGQISAAQAAEQINSLRNNDIRNDFEKYFYQKAVNQQYALDMQGGSNNLAWILSGGYDKNVNQLDATYTRLNFRSENTYKPVKGLMLTAGIYFTQSGNISGKPAYGSLPNYYGNIPSYVKLANENGQSFPIMTYYRQDFVDTTGKGKLLDWNYYPLDDYTHSSLTSKIQDFVANVGLNYEIFKDLNIDLKYRYERQSTIGEALYDQESFYTRDLINSFTQINYSTGAITRPIPLGSILDLSSSWLISQNVRAQLNYNHNWKKNTVAVIAGSEIRENHNQSNMYRTYGYDDNILTFGAVDYLNRYPYFITDFGNNFLPNPEDFGNTLNRFVSYYANGAYTVNNRYTLSISGRRDASNLFGVDINDKWKPLWSIGTAWQISNEDFYRCPLFPYLKITATYGYSGNVDPNKSALPTISYFGTSQYTQTPRARVANFPNPDLKWEKVNMFNLGVDFRSTRNIVTGSIEYYRKIGSDLYTTQPVDLTMGLNTSFISKNAAGIEGNGVDIELNSININKQFKWFSNLILGYYKDKVENFYPSSYAGVNYVGGKGGAVVGYPLISLFTYKSAGLDSLGNPRGYLNKSLSTNYTSLINDSVQNLVFKGSAIPTFFGSLGNTIGWKNFSLNARILFRLGYYFQRESINYSNLFKNLDGHSDYALRWQKRGDEAHTDVPSMVYPRNANRDLFYANSDVLATKGDNIRLQYLNLSYDFKWKGSKKTFSDLKLYVVANNVGIIWRANKYHIDPDYSNSQIPPAKSFSIGVNATF